MIVSPINVPACQRCGKPIVKGARCELFGAHNAVVHLRCKLKVTQLPNPAQSGTVPAAKPADGSWEALVADALDANLTIDDLVKPVDTGSDSYAADVVTYTDDNEVTSGFPDAPSGSHQTPTEYGDGSEDGDPSESGSPAMTLTIMTLSADIPAPAPEDIPDPYDFGMEGDSAPGEGDAQGDDGEQSETDTDSQADSQTSDSNEDEEMAAPKPNSEEFNEAVEAAAAAGMERATNIFNARVQQMAAAAIKTALPALQKNLESQIGSATTSAMQQVAQQTQKETQRMMDAAMKEVMRAISALVKENKPQVITIQQPDRELVTLDGEVFHEQFEEVLELLSLGFNTFCPGPTGAGKCLGLGTPILMFDGSIKAVEDIVVGDRLMGPDSTARRVYSLARGREMMYRVTPTKGDPYVVNESHILSLKRTPEEPGDAHRVVNISVADYLAETEWFRHTAKGWRTGVEFDYSPVPVDPYFLGLWLGDGNSHCPEIHKPDAEIIAAVVGVAEGMGLRANTNISAPGKCPRTRIIDDAAVGGIPNRLTAKMRDLGLMPSKFVPSEYKANSRTIRLAVLAGLMDSDGSCTHSGFDFINKNRTVSEDVAFLARSLGLAAYTKSCRKSDQNGTEGEYWRVSISGDCSVIPTRIPRKQAAPRRQKKDVLVTGIDVQPIGIGDYFGFTIDGDHLFLLGDFTVTHNTHLAEQVARALGLEFGMLSGSAGTTESEFFGTSYPNITTGENCYVESDFVRIYENGGLFLIDEADALDPNCFLKVNAALANGFCTVPKRYGNTRAVKHANFRCMIAANTWGTGASRQYCGRNKLDEATIDRFRAGSVAINYSKRIEASLCPDPALLGTLHRWRAEILRANMQRVLSTRFIMHAYRLQQAGKDLKYIAEKLTGGWTPKEIAEVIGDTLTTKPSGRPMKPGTKPIRY